MEKIKDGIKIDTRTPKEITDNIVKLAESYVPQWQYNEEDGDIGTALARIFNTELMHNIDRYNQVIYKYQTEFVNMLDISLMPAKPSQTVLLLSTPQTTMPGKSIKRGTKFVCDDPTGEDSYLVFESDHDLYVTNSSISDVFMTNTGDGSIIPIAGEFAQKEFVPQDFYKNENAREEEDESLLEVISTALLGTDGPDARALSELEISSEEEFRDRNKITPFFLFGKGEGIQKNALLFTHKSLFHLMDNPIYVRIKGGEELFEAIKKGDFEFLYPGEDKIKNFDKIEFLPDNETIKLFRHQEEKQLTGTGEDDKKSLIILNAKVPVLSAMKVDSITFSSSGDSVPAAAVSADTRDMETMSFAPFGETLSLYQECYIGHDDYFQKAGSKIKLEFDTMFFTTMVSLTPVEEEVQLKVIKRAPVNYLSDSVADCFAQQVSFEYYNGSGWKKLPLRRDYSNTFATETMGHYVIEFDCPDDWEPMGSGAYEGRSIKITLLKSDNCYLRPCVHHYPVIKNLNISFTYEEKYINSNEVTAIAGTGSRSLTKIIRQGRGFDAFVPTIYGDDALYMGMAKRPQEGPVSILFMIEESIRYEHVEFHFEYSSSRGFKRMRIMDFTGNMSRSGMILFMPPSDMAPYILEGKKRYWIRIVPASDGRRKLDKRLLPKITDIRINALSVRNINTLAEQDFYLDEVLPFMQFALGVNNILDAEVWVNEMGRYSREYMKNYLQENPETSRAEYNSAGEISAFFTLWKETDRLDGSQGKNCFLLDRMNNMITFGDGVITDMPKVMDNVAFKVVLRTCSGEKGNVLPGSIIESMQDISYVEVLGNPVMAYGGSNIESMDSALKRGANILSSRRRLVSIRDYVNEIYAFSDSILKAACIPGLKVDGSFDRQSLSFVLLLKNHEAGSFIFHNISQKLLNHLVTKCECTVSPGDIHVVEPIFVELSVDIWAESESLTDSYTLQELLRDTLDRYLDPVGREGLDNRDIGSLPAMAQIQLNLNVLKSKISIKKIMVTAKYTDTKGTHETDYQKLAITPFMVCKSGKHNIHLLTEGM